MNKFTANGPRGQACGRIVQGRNGRGGKNAFPTHSPASSVKGWAGQKEKMGGEGCHDQGTEEALPRERRLAVF